MLPSNRPILKQMHSDAAYRRFAFELDEMFQDDPHYTPKGGRQILDGAAKGERIIRFEDRYVVSSFVPPVPSRAFQTFVTGGVDKDHLFTDLAFARRSAPLSVHLCITTRCQYRCEHCGATVPDGHTELTKDEWIRVIGQLQDLGVANIVFSGGEPLVRDDMEEIIGTVDERSTTLLFTNGKALTPQRAESLKRAGLFILAVSLDSPYPEQHNRIRRNPRAFEYAITAIRNAARAGLYTVVSSVVFRRDLNKENLVRLFELAHDNGAHEARIHQPIPQGKLRDPAQAEEIFHTDEDIARLYQIQFAANRANNGLPKVSSFPYTEGPCKFGCGAGLLHSYISATGDLWPCDFVPLFFGNVLTDGVRETYGRMMQVAGIPKKYCMAIRLAYKLKGKKLPLGTDDSIEICRACQSRSYPGFFKDLQSTLEGEKVEQKAPLFVPLPHWQGDQAVLS